VSDFSPLANSKKFRLVYKKLILTEELSNQEKSYLLSCSIIFLSEYLSDRRKTGLFDVGYFIALKYSTDYSDYEPLYDISVNFGLFPISAYIEREGLVNSLGSLYISYKTEIYYREGIYETIEQHESRKELLNSNDLDRVFVAPTSYGKSSFILDIINSNLVNKVAVVVPTKSLLSQTYRLIVKSIKNRVIISHDEMYAGQENFIGVLTQERALRLINDENLNFDIIIVDEAHNIFDNDHRSILLSRLLRKNRKRNPSSKIYYLSPLISDPDNVKFDNNQIVDSYIIRRSIKAPELFEYRLNGDTYKYDRFCNVFHYLGDVTSYLEYIHSNIKDKNFFYINTPRKIQEFSSDFYDSLEPDDKSFEELKLISDTISNNIHSDFYCVEYVKRGLVYLHGKLPDILKEYMEYKFKQSSCLKFIVANSVVLEGINFPVDTLYVMNTYGLDEKGLTNLIGRVNRLNMVFSDENHSLKKLLPVIHFVNTEKYSSKNSKMENKIKKLRSGVFKDKVMNPTLLSYGGGFTDSNMSDSSELSQDLEGLDSKVRKIEDFLIENDCVEDHFLRIAFIETGLNSLYIDSDKVFIDIVDRIKILRGKIDSHEVIDIIFEVLVDGFYDDIVDPVFARLKNASARDFYKMYIDKCHRFTLKELIDDFKVYFLNIRKVPSKKMYYIGQSFGEEFKQREDGTYTRKDYIDLSKKSIKELVNYSLVKIKMENDFISYKINEYVKFLYLAGLIDQRRYEKFVYGSENRIGSKLAQLGIGGALINKLDRDGMLSEVDLNEWGRVEASEKFRYYLSNQDDLFQFEINKYLDK
jgi:hypothetical protein